MKRGKYRLLAVLLAMLMITLPFSSALVFDIEEKAKEANVGEAIIVNVQGYEPTVIPSSLIEDGDVPIYAFLTGITTARLLGAQANYEPFYGQAVIKQVVVMPLDESTRNAVRGTPKHVQPKQYSLEDLGYLIITLKQIEKEADVPASDKNYGLLGGSDLTLNMRAEVTFENVERLFSLVHQDLVLEQYPNEDEWKSQALDASSFFSNRGFVRAREISNDNVKLTVYGGSDMVWPYTGAPRPIGDLSLKIGETSDYYRLSEMQGLATNAFRVKLVEIVNPTERRAKIKVTINGQTQIMIVKVGSKVYPGSRLTITAIDASNNEGSVKESVSIKDYYGGADGLLTKSSKTETNQVVEDVCKDSVILLDVTEDEASWLEKIQGTTDVAVYCTAAAKYLEIVKNYYGIVDSKGVLYEDLANYRLGQIYEWLNDNQRALDYYKAAVKNKNGEFMADAMYKIETLEKQKNIYAPYMDFYENNQNIRVQLEGVLWQDKDNMPTANVQISGETTKPLVVGKNLFLQDLQETIEGRTYNYNWEVQRMDFNYITVEKKYTTNQPKEYRSLTEQIYLRQKKVLDKKDVYVSDIDLKKYALVSILPGSGEPLVSISNFTVHIPIEKRAIDFTPAQIASQLNKTQEIIKDLDNIIEKLDKVVTTWRKVCMVTFAYLTIKNSLFSGLARTQARRFALNGLDGKSGWNQFCRENSGVGKTYGRYDDCILENSGDITTTINSAQESIEQVNDDMDNYKEKPWYKELNKNFTELDKYGKYMGEDLQDPQVLRDYRYWQLMKDSDAYVQFDKYNFKKEVDTNIQLFNLTQKTKEDAYQKTLEELKSYQGFDSFEEDKKLKVFSDLYSANKINVKIESSSFSMIDKLNLGTLSRVRTDAQKNIHYAYTESGEKQLQLATAQDYRDNLKKKWDKETDQTKKDQLEKEIQSVEQRYSKTGLKAVALTTNQGQVYKEGDNFYVSQSKAYSVGDLNKEYAKGATSEFYPDGKPYCIPTSQGNFVKILDFHKDGSPSIIQEWNIGSDGLLCTNDDILVKHESVLARPEYQSENNALLNQVSRMGIHKSGDSINVGGKNFLVSSSRSQADYMKEQPNCFDTMDPGDCQLLFGVCDPVMCPPSRFNLGGTWQVNDVVQTGLVGSIILGLPNFNLPYEPVPICLTGVLAGLQNIKSVLRGYVECLNTAQVQGKSVGICDKIRSVFVCELLWREGIAILNVKGSLLTWVAQTLFGQERGGSEYLTFESSLQNIADSVSFFTKSYATTAFAAYQSRSFNEVGTTICKQAIFGKFPGLGSFLDEIAQPESPPQYTALLTEMPFSERLQQSRYQTFYHIYAGEDKEATISVWLEDSTRKLPAYYVTDRCEGRRSDIPKGGISSQNLDCVAPSGYDRVCISINGMLECGFGKVSSDFAIDYLNDLIVEDELGRKISSEEDCYPSAPKTSPSLLSLPLPGEIDMMNTGIVRVCSLQNPGQSTSAKNWKVIGNCGKDSTGRSLGSCWVDTTTVSIHDTERMANVMDALNEQGFEQQKLSLGITGLLDKEQSLLELNRINQMAKDDYKTKLSALISYSLLSKATAEPKIAAEASYKAVELLLSKEILELAKKDPDRIINQFKVEFQKELEKILLEYTNKAKEARSKYSGDDLEEQMKDLEEQYMDAVEQAYKKVTEDISAKFKGTTDDVNALIEKEIETKLYEEYYNKDLKQITIVAGTQKVVESKCNECSGLTCNTDKCHALGNCYLEKKWYGVNLLASSCNFCTQATSCSDFNDDFTMCNNQQCTATLGGCEYKEGKCVKKEISLGIPFVSPAEAQCSFIVDTAALYLNTGYGDLGDCSPEKAKAELCTTQCGSFVNNVFGYCGVDIGIPLGHGRTKCDATSYVSDNKFTDERYLQPGDLFVASSTNSDIDIAKFGHTGIYVGKGKLSELTENRKCYLKFTPDSEGDYVFIHSTGPVCYMTLTQLKRDRQIYTYCRHDACCLSNDPVCHKTQPDTNLLAQIR
ncbi:MAG: hypothetical protein KKB39_05025 [Nanoarchaeota archaeon]|nr:hypothetical protein [Nanoarchaeota archaeon]